MQITQDMINQRYAELPADIQRVITSDLVSNNLEVLGQKYKLRVDKVGDLIDEVGMVMLGFKKSSDFIGNLSRRLEIDRETAESMAVDIDNEVFKKIRESLRTVQFGSGHPDTPEAHEDPDYGHSPTRDSLIQDIERHGNNEVLEPTPYERRSATPAPSVDPYKEPVAAAESAQAIKQAPSFAATADYSADAFNQATAQSTQPVVQDTYREPVLDISDQPESTVRPTEPEISFASEQTIQMPRQKVVTDTVKPTVAPTIKPTVESAVPTYQEPAPAASGVLVGMEDRIDPSKSFQDHLQNKVDENRPVVNSDPYREAI